MNIKSVIANHFGKVLIFFLPFLNPPSPRERGRI